MAAGGDVVLVERRGHCITSIGIERAGKIRTKTY